MPRARKVCAAVGCTELAPCPTHPKVPWQGSRRRQELPSGWSHRIVPRILRRDPICQLGLVCGGLGRATEVHHIGDRDDHRDSNLQGVCVDCHNAVTQTQAAEARGHAVP